MVEVFMTEHLRIRQACEQHGIDQNEQIMKCMLNVCRITGVGVEQVFEKTNRVKIVYTRQLLYWNLSKLGYCTSLLSDILNVPTTNVYRGVEVINSYIGLYDYVRNDTNELLAGADSK